MRSNHSNLVSTLKSHAFCAFSKLPLRHATDQGMCILRPWQGPEDGEISTWAVTGEIADLGVKPLAYCDSADEADGVIHFCLSNVVIH
ncbi:hypothetical protein [Enterovibrio paralichthyis]|uniref:hypothetical protein n=1 Tax=Enterovibrio paralichthyis TaxID=2853805 RepID=UPI001C4725C8|nr:hypothetical protein [Enterovibrio paralichthyis]MBV7300226.1 hypothetical protein [Enterovibrio paralichthyis]